MKVQTMGALRKLKRSSHDNRQRLESIPRRSWPPVKKMSEVLLDFAEPLLEACNDEQLKGAIAIAAASWNMTFLPPEEQKAALDELIMAAAKGDTLSDRETREVLHWLANRKKLLFADDNRIIIDYELVEEEAGPRLLVTSAPANDTRR